MKRERASKSRRGRERELHARSFGCAPRLPQASSSCRPILSSFACGCRPVAAISCSCAVPKSTSNRAPKKKKLKKTKLCRRRRRRRPLSLCLSRSLARVAHSDCFTLFQTILDIDKIYNYCFCRYSNNFYYYCC